MNQETVNKLKGWFFRYVRGFKTGDADQRRNVLLKEDHTRRVCEEILCIGRALGLGGKDLRVAEVAALFHDLGRFEQYARHRTFVDRNSFNHAAFGVKILEDQGLLDGIGNSQRNTILRAITYHNRINLPRKENAGCLLIAGMLRDADKLDIWRVVIDYYNRSGGERNSVLELELPETPGVSHEVCQDLMAGRIVASAHLKNLNDFKLLQAGWVYDLNFEFTFRCVRERGILEKIRAVLPDSEEIAGIFDRIHAVIDGKAPPGISGDIAV